MGEQADGLTEAERLGYGYDVEGQTVFSESGVLAIIANRLDLAHMDLAGTLDAAREDVARAWDEGYSAAETMARMWGHTDGWEDPEPENPYRAVSEHAAGPCASCDGSGLAWLDNPDAPGFLLAENCATCGGLGVTRCPLPVCTDGFIFHGQPTPLGESW